MKRYVTTVGAMWFSIPLVLVGIIITQNVLGIWPDQPPVNVQVVIHDTVPAAADVDLAEVKQLENALANAVADSLRARTRADSVSFYLFASIGARPMSWDFRLLLLTFFMGALGAWIHTASSFVRYVGNREFTSSWGPWYLMRPLVGGGMALIFYMVIRTGLVTTAGDTVDALSHYSAAAFAGLVGLFSERASKKLGDVFDALFTPRADDQDKDQLGEKAEAAGAAPQIKSLNPAWIKAGTQAVPVVIQGSGFGDEPIVKLNGKPINALRQDEARLQVVLDNKATSTVGTLEIVVERGGVASAPKRLPVTP